MRLEVLAQDHAHVHPPQCVALLCHEPASQRRRDIAGTLEITPAGNHSCGLRYRISIPEEHHIETTLPQHPGGRSSRTLTPGSIQDLHGYAPPG